MFAGLDCTQRGLSQARCSREVTAIAGSGHWRRREGDRRLRSAACARVTARCGQNRRTSTSRRWGCGRPSRISAVGSREQNQPGDVSRHLARRAASRLRSSSMKATSPGPPMLPSRAGACRSAQRRTPTRQLPLSALLTAEAIPSALRIGEARQISVPIIVLPSCHPADFAIASDARKDHTPCPEECPHECAKR
jgi:hypothetical protein